MKQVLISVALGVAAFVLAASRINHGLIQSPLPAGPGMTLDEPLYILQGSYLFEKFCEQGPLMFTPSGAETIFGSKEYLPDHPPLGRIFLIIAHEGLSWLISGAEISPINVTAARFGSCFAFGLTVFLLCEFARRRFGLTTSILTALALMLMPRVVGHARIAALETTTTLAWLAACIPLWCWWSGDQPPTSKQSLLSGIFWGLLMLTKVQAVLLPPVVLLWAVWRYRLAAIRPLVIWGMTGTLVFFAGWPWLWLDPVGHTLQYLGKAAERPTLYVWYLGERWADKAVPWHYPIVMTAITVPLLIFSMFLLRLWQRKLEPVEKFILISAMWPLIVFAIPGTPVYDGVRLFLIVMPGVAFLAARGFANLLRQQEGRKAALLWVVSGLLALLPLTQIFQPYALNSYSLLVGREQGAATLGMEAGYWADGLNGEFWNQVPENSKIVVAPVSHQVQLEAMASFVPAAKRRGISLSPYYYDPQQQQGLTLLIHRLADLPVALRANPEGATVVAETTSNGVVLCRLVDTSENSWTEIPPWPKK